MTPRSLAHRLAAFGPLGLLLLGLAGCGAVTPGRPADSAGLQGPGIEFHTDAQVMVGFGGSANVK